MNERNPRAGNDAAGEIDVETREWLESLDYVIAQGDPERVRRLLRRLQARAQAAGIQALSAVTTPYINTIPAAQQPPYPGSREIERRIKSIIRWNAMAMVVRANRDEDGIGGHISTYASAATLFEVGFNHFFRAPTAEHEGDMVYFQGHAAPGVYARAFLEGRIDERALENFRRELAPGGGLSSYPHPWLMPHFWQFPTVSMGLGPIMSIYQARFNRYLEHRGLKPPTDAKVWAFLGDGETDEPETLGAISLAAREGLDNLIWVVNCNLQRLDGPVRGNHKIIQELEAIFRGAGWNVIKVIWGSDWDPLLERDAEGLLVERMNEVVDGQYQRYSVESGAYIRQDFFGVHPRLLELVAHLSDEQLARLRRGGHDPEKVYAAYKAAVEHRGSPTVILAKTVKGYGLGEAGEGRNITHQQKKLNEDELRAFRTRFGIPISDERVAEAPFYRPPDDSPEMKYLRERREALGGYVPQRSLRAQPLKAPSDDLFAEFYQGSERPVSTTMALVRILVTLLRDKEIGRLIVPIIPDEARTFGMEALFRQYGIYSAVGQLYEPVDQATLLPYREAKDGQILEEGITEAGAMASFIAAGTAPALHGINTIPFFVFYSMFGFQRVGDLIWAAGDARAKGFLIGATAGRTTLAGEGLQHQDGNSHLFALAYPTVVAYDPAYAYELAVIVREGIRRMYEEQEDLQYYITVTNEPYEQPPMPPGEDVRQGILRGMYRLQAAPSREGERHVQLLGSGAILREVVKAQELLAGYGVSADVWSVTSYKELYKDGVAAERWNMLHPGAEKRRVPLVTTLLSDAPGVVVAAVDYVKALGLVISRWVPRPYTVLGTDGFGRSDSRARLRDFFEVDARYIALAALSSLAQAEALPWSVVAKARSDFEIDPEKADPMFA